MRTSLDNYLGVLPQALSVAAQRNELLAANLANVDTPNYKARDLDFKAAMSAAGGAPAGSGSTLPLNASSAQSPASILALTPSGSMPQTSDGVATDASTAGVENSAALKYRVPLAASLDGNTVDEQLEQSAFAENTVRYQATLTFLNNSLRNLMTAITGS